MKKKELMKRLAAFSIAAMVTASTLPTTTFAADIEFSDVAEDVEVEDNADVAGESVLAEDNADVAEGYDLFSDSDAGIAVQASMNLKIVVQDTQGNIINGAKITLLNVMDEPISAEADGSYVINSTSLYDLTVEADGYEKFNMFGSIKDSTFTVTLKKNDTVDPNQEIVDSLKAKFDETVTDITPSYDVTNINDMVTGILKAYQIEGTEDVKVSVEDNSNDDYGGVKSNGTIIWRKRSNHKTTFADVTFKLTIGMASATTKTHRVNVGWDVTSYKDFIASEMSDVTLAKEVTNDITLPLEKTYTKISWESSDPEVISIGEAGATDTTVTGTVNRTTEDQKVTLIASFVANPDQLNDVEKTASETTYGTQTKTFEVTVKASPFIGLSDKIKEAKTLLDTIEEGTAPGQYKVGSKDTLQAVINAAAEALDDENETEAEAAKVLETLNDAIKAAKDAQIPTTATVTVHANLTANEAGETKSIEVKSNDAAAYGYEKPEATRNKVTVADALYALHAAMYGEEFTKNPSEYLEIGSNGWINTAFGEKAAAIGFLVNNKFTDVSNVAVLNDGDELNVFLYGDTTGWSDKYLYFQNVASSVDVNQELAVTLMASGYPADEAVAGCTVVLKNTDTAETVTGKTDENGKVVLKASKAGKYQLTVTAAPYDYYVVPVANVEVKDHVFDNGKVTKEATCKEDGVKTYTCTTCDATKTEAIAKTTDHKYTWKVVSEATVFAPEKQKGTCSVCGATVTKENGTKLTATIKLNVTSIKLQKKQTTKKIKVTMANGDSVKSWTSSNKKIVTVNKNGVIKAGKKTGTAKITVTLKGGKKAILKVKVQKASVKTTKISGLKSKVVVNNGKKLTLKPVISPLTSQDKVTYTSSNKKVATVNKNGVITAKKKGIAKIKVKSGKKSYTVTVTVK